MMIRGLMLVIAGLLTAPAVQAVEALTTEELMSHCDKYHDEQAREDRVARNVVGEYDQEESFSERAARTRIGNSLERFGASVYAEYCLGDPVQLKEVVEHVVQDATNPGRVEANLLARDLVY
jgi:hypothetical protein